MPAKRGFATDISRLLEDCQAVLHGHYLLTSGLHSPTYLEKFRLLQHPSHTERLCGLVAEHFRGWGMELVAGPALGGVILAYEVARQMGIRAIYAEREGEARVFRRALSIEGGEKVLVVDDILTTGGSIREVMEAVGKVGGRVVGVGVLIDRSDGRTDFGVPLFSCHRLSIPAYAPGQCPQCAEGRPLVRPGSAL